MKALMSLITQVWSDGIWDAADGNARITEV